MQGPQPGRIVAKRGTFLKDTELFDHLEFGIAQKDARAMSLSTRKLLELSFLALLDSGIQYRGKNIGCFASGITHDILSLGNMVDMMLRFHPDLPPNILSSFRMSLNRVDLLLESRLRLQTKFLIISILLVLPFLSIQHAVLRLVLCTLPYSQSVQEIVRPLLSEDAN